MYRHRLCISFIYIRQGSRYNDGMYSKKAEAGIIGVFLVVLVGLIAMSVHVYAQQTKTFYEGSSSATLQVCKTVDGQMVCTYESSRETTQDDRTYTSVTVGGEEGGESNEAYTEGGDSDQTQVDKDEGNEQVLTDPGRSEEGAEEKKDTTSDENEEKVAVALTRPACPIVSLPERVIVDFGEQRLRSDRDVTAARTREEPVVLMPGTYTVTLAAWDGYEGREKVTQPREQIYAVVFSGESVVARTGTTHDLKNNVREATEVRVVNEALELPEHTTAVQVVHAAYPDTSNPNSLYPLCIGFDRHKEEVSKEEAVEIKASKEQDTQSKETEEKQSEEIVQEEPIVCAQDRRQCPDGSYVYRQKPDCQFARCPRITLTDEAGQEQVREEESPTHESSPEIREASTPARATQETQSILDRLRRTQESTPAPTPSRQPTQREAEVIEERRQILEQVPQETRRFDPREREEIVREERTRRGEEEREVIVERALGTVLNSPIDDIEDLVEREAGERVSLREPRREVVERERTDPYEMDIQRLVYGERLDLSILRDSDGDGISDFDEIFIYGTDPFNAHTAGGLLTDGERVMLGLDPLSTSTERLAVASPRTTGEEDPFQYSVSNIELLPASDPDGVDAIRFQGLAPLNSLVTLVMFSEPIIVTVKANDNGNWEYVLDVPVEEGRHELFVTSVNAQGDIVRRSPSIPFVRTAEAIEFTPLSGATSQSGIMAGNFLAIALALFLGIGFIALLVLGLSHRRRNIIIAEPHGRDTLA